MIQWFFFQYKNVKFCLLILLQIINDSKSESVLDYVKTLQECDVSVCGKMFVTNEMATDLVVRKWMNKIVSFLRIDHSEIF